MSRENKAFILYILFYTILFLPVCVLIDDAVFAFLPSPAHRLQATAPVCVVVMWVSKMSCRHPSSHTIPVQFPYCFFSPPHSSLVKCRKNRYPLINSKVVKILSSSKCCESSEDMMNTVPASMKQKG